MVVQSAEDGCPKVRRCQALLALRCTSGLRYPQGPPEGKGATTAGSFLPGGGFPRALPGDPPLISSPSQLVSFVSSSLPNAQFFLFFSFFNLA